MRFREPISLEPSALVDKIARGGRGGFCYELNGAFATLLEAIGFPVEHLAGRSYEGASTLGPPFDHLALRVDLELAAALERWFGVAVPEGVDPDPPQPRDR